MLTLELRLVLETPLHIGAATDTPDTLHSFTRDVRGRPYIPATTLKGLHRAMTEQVATALNLRICNPPLSAQMCHPIAGKPACPVCRIFGSPWLAGRLRYRNLIAGTAPIVEHHIQASQSRRRRVQLTRHTSQYEVLPAGTVFSGQVDHQIADPALLGLALAGLRSITTLGSGGSLGYGLCRVEVRALDASKHPVNDADLAAWLHQLVRAKP
jgi:CRISPR/Cas system CSM-associated protein Csm3 (group 7 of RAMP superfamily)